jgi:branched-chain amino acid aminotransferase
MENQFLDLTQPLEEEISVFETMRSYDGYILGLEDHLTRLEESARDLGIPSPPPREELKRKIQEELGRFGQTHARIRPTLFRSGLRFFVQALPAMDPSWYEDGVTIATTPDRLPLVHAAPVGAKATWYGPQALTHLTHPGSNFEILFLDTDGFVGELRINNLFIVKLGILKTPPAVHILNGVTRRVMLDLASQIAITVEEIPLSRHDIYNADECFITNSVVEVLPVRSLDGRMIGSGKPGPIAKKLRELYQRAIHEKASS